MLKTSKLIIVLFCHYPFFINAFDEPETYSNIAIETRNRYLHLFKENNVDAVFAGHLHNNGSAKYGNMEMVTTSAVGNPGKSPFRNPHCKGLFRPDRKCLLRTG